MDINQLINALMKSLLSGALERKSLAVELSDEIAIVVEYDNTIEQGLMWTTKQCFGYTSSWNEVQESSWHFRA